LNLFGIKVEGASKFQLVGEDGIVVFSAVRGKLSRLGNTSDEGISRALGQLLLDSINLDVVFPFDKGLDAVGHWVLEEVPRVSAREVGHTKDVR